MLGAGVTTPLLGKLLLGAWLPVSAAALAVSTLQVGAALTGHLPASGGAPGLVCRKQQAVAAGRFLSFLVRLE